MRSLGWLAADAERLSLLRSHLLLLAATPLQKVRMNLHGTTFQVSSTAAHGVVSSDTRLQFEQRGDRVIGRYRGGSIRRGWLVGDLVGRTLRFRYAQTEAT